MFDSIKRVARSIARKVKKAAKKAQQAVETAVNAAEEVVADVVETVGNGIEDGIEAAGNYLSEHLPAGKYVGVVLKWVGTVVSSALDVVAAVVKGLFGFVSRVLTGVILILGGILSLDGALIIEGFLDILSGLAGALLLILGKAVAFIQSVLHLQSFKRRLTTGEVKLLKRVFYDSVALYNVRIIEGWAGFFGVSSQPFTLGNTIYMRNVSTSEQPEVLVHECTHVWQYQNKGVWYASDAVAAQWFIARAYEWEREIKRGNDDWVEFNKEAQGEFLETLFVYGAVKSGNVIDMGKGVFYDADGKKRVAFFEFNGINNTERANEAVAEVRDAQSVRLSSRWS